MKQQTLAGLEKYAKTTRRAQFLAEMDRVVPWAELCALIEPHYRIPTLSWWPRAMSDRLLRWSGRGDSYDDIRFTTRSRIVRTAARHGLALEDVTDEALTTQLDRYDSMAGRLAGRASRLLPGSVRRRLLDFASPQWFFFVRHAGGE